MSNKYYRSKPIRVKPPSSDGRGQSLNHLRASPLTFKAASEAFSEPQRERDVDKLEYVRCCSTNGTQPPNNGTGNNARDVRFPGS
jgi:hypothetical protein